MKVINSPQLYTVLEENIHRSFSLQNKGARENVKFEWMLTPWSECTQSCGITAGFRVIKKNN